MFKKKFTAHFIVLFVPVLIVSTLLYFLYTMNTQDHIQMNWLIIIFLAIILDAFFTWIFTRKEEEKKPE